MIKEQQRVTMRKLPMAQKLVIMQQQQSRASQQNASIVPLVHEVRGNPSPDNLQKLRVAINQGDEKTLNQFLDSNGIQLLVEIVSKYARKPTFE